MVGVSGSMIDRARKVREKGIPDKVRDWYDQKAKERQTEHGKTAPGKRKNTPGKLTGSVGDARDEAGRAVGVSGSLQEGPGKVQWW